MTFLRMLFDFFFRRKRDTIAQVTCSECGEQLSIDVGLVVEPLTPPQRVQFIAGTQRFLLDMHAYKCPGPGRDRKQER